MVPSFCQIQNRDCFSGLSAGEQQGPHSGFQGCDALFDRGLGGVHDPGVDIAKLFKAEKIGGVCGVVEGE